ncbi:MULTISPECIES: DUF6653 family protein [Haloferax]|uniref:Uncharacterized protein n=1 Tax=Haloferax marinum TaxID=2666143 RepID=A0A6A8G2M9_9EURY|nr:MULTISPECIES: DUF6653 family protein [Haloferax]KAB1196349.1 hypothetical protein Hfx1150_01980 [Haloferax sp. CBA1150]MRW95341.1 hypothetical protein [Haloferax marinum]
MTAESETQHRGAVGELVESVFWSPHANPRSVWAFVATYPILIAAIYRRSKPLAVATLLSIVLNLVGVSPPESDDAWATRVVLGEQVWFDRGVLSEKGTFGLTAVGGVVNLYTIRAAVKRQRVRTVVGMGVSMAFMFVFFDRMVELYDTYGSGEFEGSTGVELE